MKRKKLKKCKGFDDCFCMLCERCNPLAEETLVDHLGYDEDGIAFCNYAIRPR